jgi:ATP-dependent protease ClpP protease subunit
MAMAKLKAQDKAPIWVYLMSPGGIVQCGFAMHDIIKSVTGLGVEVNGLATGVVASMAMAVLQAMTRRYSLPNTQFMLHEVSQVMGSSQAKLTEAEEMQAEHKRMNAIVMGILAERSGMPAAKIMEQIKKKDVWLDPSKAKKFGPKGLIDEIVDTLPIQLV